MPTPPRRGVCRLCDYDKCAEALEFHHFTDEKNFGISQRGYTRSWEAVKKEPDICILLCANCHREVENGITQLPQETGAETRQDNGES